MANERKWLIDFFWVHFHRELFGPDFYYSVIDKGVLCALCIVHSASGAK